jgi:antitoxin CptB
MDEVLRALKYRAWHRGTREADMMIGGFFDAHHASWSAHERALFAALLAEQDVDIMAWAIGTSAVPGRYQGSMMDAFRRLDFIKVSK